VIVVRYADDLVVGFRYWTDAERKERRHVARFHAFLTGSQKDSHLLRTNPIKISPVAQPPNFSGSRNDRALRSSIVIS
jgi:hypothetical protein